MSALADQPFEPYMIIDGVRASMYKKDLRDGQPTIMDGLTIPWGRSTIVAQPDTSASPTFTVRQRTGYDGVPSIFDYCHAGATVQIFAAGAAAGGTDRLVWAGEIASAKIQPTDPYAIEATVTCVDESATLGSIKVGAQSWPEETAYDRFQHILSDAGARIHDLRPDQDPAWRWQLTGEMDESIRDFRIAYRAGDRDTPLKLIQDLASSIGGIAWITADTNGPYIWIEDPTRREGLRQFVVDPVTTAVTIQQIALNPGTVTWDAKDVIPDSVEWGEDPSQSINLIEATWQNLSGVDDQGNPTYSDDMVEQTDSTSKKGIRPFAVSTDMVRRGDASMLAYHWLTWTHSADWIADGLSIDTARMFRKASQSGSIDQLAHVLDLLDVRTRIGYRLNVTGLPAWGPAGPMQSYYVEGGTCTWSGNRWHLELTATANAIGGGALCSDFSGSGVTFADFPADLRVIDIAGVAGPLGFSEGFGGGQFGDQPFGM